MPTSPSANPKVKPRLLLTPPLTGAENMALDEALLRRAATDGPVVRVYSWSPPTLSLGYGQRSADVDPDACAAAGVDVTRRLTGGRAVLHHLELTYSVVVEADRLNVGRNVTAAYEILSGGLIRALSELGLDAALAPRAGRAGDRDPACFATSIGGDLTVGGRKLIGSAQCHRFGGILQHGAIPLAVDDELLSRCLRRPPRAARAWTSLAELGRDLTAEELAEALATGFTDLLGDRPAIGAPTGTDLEGMRELVAKYADQAWVYRI